MTSTEEEYRSLPLDKLELADVSFEDFYFYSETALDRNCNALMEKGELTNKQQIQIRKVWELHPKRQQVLTQQEEREQTYIDIIQRQDQALQESKRHALLSPVQTPSVFALSVLNEKNLTYTTIPQLPDVGGNLSISVEIPIGGWINEYHFNSCMFYHLRRIFPGSNLINSEWHRWMEVPAGGTPKNDLKPDFFDWPFNTDCLIVIKLPPAKFPVEGCTYGHPIDYCAFMVDTVLDGKNVEINLSEIGKLFVYLDTLSKCGNKNPHGMFYNDTSFVVASYLNGSLESIYQGMWSTPGCVESLQAYLNNPDLTNGTTLALKHFLQAHPESTVDLALGRGSFGCVFLISRTNAPASALKIVPTESGNYYAYEEYQRMVQVGRDHPELIAQIKEDSLVFQEKFLYYEITDLGKQGNNVLIPARQAFIKLFELHNAGIIHGDPRITNIILLNDESLRWIDLRHTGGTFAHDVVILIESVFTEVKSIASNPKVLDLAMSYQRAISVTKIISIYEFCKKL